MGGRYKSFLRGGGGPRQEGCSAGITKEYHMALHNCILHQLERHLLLGGGGKRGMPPLVLVAPVPEDARSDAPDGLLLFPGIEIEKVCPSFKE